MSGYYPGSPSYNAAHPEYQPPPEDTGGTPTTQNWKPPFTWVPDPNMTPDQLRQLPGYQIARAAEFNDADSLMFAAAMYSNQDSVITQANYYMEHQQYWLDAHPGYQQGKDNGLWSSPADYNVQRNQYWNVWHSAHPGSSQTFDPNDKDFATWFGTASTSGWRPDVAAQHIPGVSGHNVNNYGSTASDDFFKSWGFSDAEIAIMRAVYAGTDNDPDHVDLANFGSYVYGNADNYAHQGHGHDRAYAYNQYKNYSPVSAPPAPSSQPDYTGDQIAAEARAEAARKDRINTAAGRLQQGYDPSVSSLFTPDELKNAAIWDAGGEWGDGKASKLLQLASPLNQMFQTFYGRPITRAELDQYYASGATPETVSHEFSARGYQTANTPDVQYYTGAFGDTGAYTPDQVYQMGMQQAGGQTQFGQALQLKFNQAVQRAQVAFQGTLAHLERSNRFQGNTPPDIGA